MVEFVTMPGIPSSSEEAGRGSEQSGRYLSLEGEIPARGKATGDNNGRVKQNCPLCFSSGSASTRCYRLGILSRALWRMCSTFTVEVRFLTS